MPRKKGSGRTCRSVADGVMCITCDRHGGKCHRNQKNKPAGCCCAYCKTEASLSEVMEIQAAEVGQPHPANKRARRSMNTANDHAAEFTPEQPLKYQTDSERNSAFKRKKTNQLKYQQKQKKKHKTQEGK